MINCAFYIYTFFPFENISIKEDSNLIYYILSLLEGTKIFNIRILSCKPQIANFFSMSKFK